MNYGKNIKEFDDIQIWNAIFLYCILTLYIKRLLYILVHDWTQYRVFITEVNPVARAAVSVIAFEIEIVKVTGIYKSPL